MKDHIIGRNKVDTLNFGMNSSSFTKNSLGSDTNKSLDHINTINQNFNSKLKAAQTTIKRSEDNVKSFTIGHE